MSLFDVTSKDGKVSKRQLDSEQKCNKEFVLKVLNEGENIYPLICDELKKDTDIASVAVQIGNSKNYQIYRDLVHEPSLEMIIKAAEKFPWNFFTGKEMETIFDYGGGLYENRSIEYIWHREFEIIKKDGKDVFEVLDYKEDELLSLEKGLHTELRNSGYRLLSDYLNEYFKEHINHYEICLALIKNNGELIRFLDFKYSKDKKLAKIAVEKNGLAYKYLSQELQSDYEIALTALTNDFRIYDYLPNNLKGDAELIKKVLILSGMNLLKKSYRMNPNDIDNKYQNQDEIKDFLLISIANTERKIDIIFIDQELAEICKNEEVKIENDDYCLIFGLCGFDEEFFKIYSENIFFGDSINLRERIEDPEWLDSDTVNFKSFNHMSKIENKDIDYEWVDSAKLTLVDEIRLKIKELKVPKKFTHLILREELNEGVYHIGLPLKDELKKVNKLEIYEDYIKLDNHEIEYNEHLFDLTSRDWIMEDYFIVDIEKFEFYCVQRVRSF